MPDLRFQHDFSRKSVPTQRTQHRFRYVINCLFYFFNNAWLSPSLSLYPKVNLKQLHVSMSGLHKHWSWREKHCCTKLLPEQQPRSRLPLHHSRNFYPAVKSRWSGESEQQSQQKNTRLLTRLRSTIETHDI